MKRTKKNRRLVAPSAATSYMELTKAQEAKILPFIAC
jgi:hypothetical protein